jgi:tRNA(Met) C34 N-acetyltransferase TmcA
VPVFVAVLVIKVFLKKQMPHVFAEPYFFHHDEALHLLEARRGRGKSYFLMYYVWCAISQRKPMWCNFIVDIYRFAL